MRAKGQARRDKIAAIAKAETEGLVADSREVRWRLVSAVMSGEMTLQEANDELGRVKRTARSKGLKTRAQIRRKA